MAVQNEWKWNDAMSLAVLYAVSAAGYMQMLSVKEAVWTVECG